MSFCFAGVFVLNKGFMKDKVFSASWGRRGGRTGLGYMALKIAGMGENPLTCATGIIVAAVFPVINESKVIKNN